MRQNERCIDGRVMRHIPFPDDPDFEQDVGECPHCYGRGCIDGRPRKAWNGGNRPSLPQQLAYVAEQLRSVRIMVNRGHGDVSDEPDPICEEAAASIDAIAAQVETLAARLKSVIAHWDEFGPEHDFGETIDRARKDTTP